jgi:hypothetical protein
VLLLNSGNDGWPGDALAWARAEGCMSEAPEPRYYYSSDQGNDSDFFDEDWDDTAYDAEAEAPDAV